MNNKSHIELLKDLISIPSFSRKENKSADRIENWFKENGIRCSRHKNNIYAFNKYYKKDKKTLLLNSHHDTVKPNEGYTKDPHNPEISNGRIYGLGSNDAGGSLVTLLNIFKYFYDNKKLKVNLIIAATAEEENSGPNGLKSLLKRIPSIDFAIVGEPTLMKAAVAEKGLVVCDCIIRGKASHAAHPNSENPILKISDIIKSIEKIRFKKISKLLGPVKLTITQINAGTQHNVVPSSVEIVIDVRVNDLYSNEEIVELIKENVNAEVYPRSMDLNSSSISNNHPIVKAVNEIGIPVYGSPTLSDQTKLSCPSIKIGPGDSSRSHTADEFIYIEEIEKGCEIMKKLIKKLLL